MLIKDGNVNLDETSMFPEASTQEIEFTLNQEALGNIVDRLTDVYDSPALAAAREVISNAYDASVSYERENGVVGEINIEVPTFSNDYTFSVEDKASGMSMEVLVENYCTYGNSIKIDDMLVTGSKGMGAKAPFAAVNTFFIETSDGENTITATAVRNSGELPRLIDVNTTPANGAHGTKVSIPMKHSMASDRDEVTATAIRMAGFITNHNAQVINIEELSSSYVFNSTHSLDSYVHFSNVEHLGKTMRMFVKKSALLNDTQKVIEKIRDKSHLFSFSISNDLSSREFDVLLNGYVYRASNLLEDADYLLEIVPGVVDFPSSRDTITKNSRYAELFDSISNVTLKDDRIAELLGVYFTLDNPGRLMARNILCFSNNSGTYEHYKGLLEKVVNLNGKETSMGEKIDIRQEIIDVINLVVNCDVETPGMFYMEELNRKEYRINNFYSEAKGEVNSSFKSYFKKIVIENSVDATDSSVSFYNLFRAAYDKKSEFSIFEGKDSRYASLSSKVSKIEDISRGQRRALFFLPAGGKLTEEQRKIFDAISYVLCQENVHYKSFDEIDIVAPTKSDKSFTVYEANSVNEKNESMHKDFDDERKFFAYVNNVQKIGFDSYDSCCNTSSILEKIESAAGQDFRYEVLVVPNEKNRSNGTFAMNTYVEHMFKSYQELGVENILDVRVLIVVAPTVSLINDIEELGVDITVYAGSKGYTTKSIDKRKKCVPKTGLMVKALMAEVNEEEVNDVVTNVVNWNNMFFLGNMETSKLHDIMELVSSDDNLSNSEFAKDFVEHNKIVEGTNHPASYAIYHYIRENDLTTQEFFGSQGIFSSSKVEEDSKKFSDFKFAVRTNIVLMNNLFREVINNGEPSIVKLITDENIDDVRKKAANRFVDIVRKEVNNA